MPKNFFLDLSKKVIESVNNNYTDNFDIARYDSEEAGLQNILKESFKSLIARAGFYKNEYLFERYFDQINKNYKDYEGYEYLYNQLESNESKKSLVTIVAYRLMGYKKIKLPLHSSSYIHQYEEIKRLRLEKFDYSSLNNALKLYKHNLNSIGFPISIILSSYGVLIDFIHEQYRFKEDNIEIKVEKGDFVIDGGGCYGDTAMYFSFLAGQDGKVFSFEFVPSNLAVFQQNLLLNPTLSSAVVIEEKPLSMISDKVIYYSDCGPASRVSEDFIQEGNGETKTIAIDDFILSNQIQKVDFIKLDIEGSEFEALKGASKTIKHYRPKLAIALYHSPTDFGRIPKLIHELEPAYKFYIKHATINNEETMLFARV
jgi:FkbM family methyltransferase